MDFENLLNFERASVATYYDSTGSLKTAAINEPRFDHDPNTLEPLGLLVEEERENILLNSSSPVDQSVTLTAGQYTLSVYGEGSCSIGAYGSASAGSPLTFTATEGGESVVVAGTLDRFQLELGGFATSFIQTDGSPAARSADICRAKSLNPWLDSNEGSILVSLDKKDGSYLGSYAALSDGTDNNIISIRDTFIEYTGTNYMPSPFDPENWLADADGTVTNTTIANPSGETFAGLAEQTTTGQFFIASVSGLGISIGEKAYLALICKPIGTYETALRFRFADSQGFLGDTVLSGTTGLRTSGGTRNTNVTDLSDGFKLLQVEFTASRNDNNFLGQLVFWTNDDTGFAPIGSQLYVQAAYFGKADDWPANISGIEHKTSGLVSIYGDRSLTKNYTSGLAKLGFSYNDTDWVAVNGTTGYSGAVDSVPSFDNFDIGNTNGNNVFNGYIKDVRYYPRKLSESELITALSEL